MRPNLTLSYGIRYERQNNINSILNFAPRLGVAWSPGAADSTKPPKMVIRAGGGVFYNRFSENNTLQANRFNGVNQQQFFLSEVPLYNADNQYVEPLASPLDTLDFNNPIPLSSLSSLGRQITWRVADNLQSPVVYLGGRRSAPLPSVSLCRRAVLISHSDVIRALYINAPSRAQTSRGLSEHGRLPV